MDIATDELGTGSVLTLMKGVTCVLQTFHVGRHGPIFA